MKSTISYFPLELKKNRCHNGDTSSRRSCCILKNEKKTQQSARCVILQRLSNTAASSFVASRSPRTETAQTLSMQKVREVSPLSDKQAEGTKCGCRNGAIRYKSEPLELHWCDQVTNKITEWAQRYTCINCAGTDLSECFMMSLH